MMNSISIKMPYIGKVLSVNHYKYRGKYTRPEVKSWMEELGWKIKSAHIEGWELPISVTCSGLFRDKRSTPDLSNLGKVILDAIEEVTGINDRHMRWHDGMIWLKKDEEPELLITIEAGI